MFDGPKDAVEKEIAKWRADVKKQYGEEYLEKY